MRTQSGVLAWFPSLSHFCERLPKIVVIARWAHPSFRTFYAFHIGGIQKKKLVSCAGFASHTNLGTSPADLAHTRHPAVCDFNAITWLYLARHLSFTWSPNSNDYLTKAAFHIAGVILYIQNCPRAQQRNVKSEANLPFTTISGIGL
jgi:hypothetical protein